MLITRIISAVVALPIVVAGVFAGGIWFFGGVTIVSLIGGWEFGQIMKAGGYKTTPFFSLVLIALLILNGYRSDLSLTCIISVILLGSLTWQLYQADTKTPTADWALTIMGGLFIGWGMAHLVMLRKLGDGLAWVWLALLATWGADTLGYVVGRTIGRHRLWPRLSPKKTWEGFIGGILGAFIGPAIVVPFSGLNWQTVLVITAVIPIIGLFGDLSISMMKRNMGVKDSSGLFPGHGGFLDRMDSLLFVSVVVYYYVIWGGLAPLISSFLAMFAS